MSAAAMRQRLAGRWVKTMVRTCPMRAARRELTSCDAADGVSDNLIQNPAACAFDPDTLVPGTLSQPQADALKVYLGATRDHRGGVLYPGFAVSDLHGPR